MPNEVSREERSGLSQESAKKMLELRAENSNLNDGGAHVRWKQMDKSCKHCGVSFFVLQDDQRFYRKIAPVINGKTFSIPPPTLCPLCRQQRRMSFRNERHLYRRKCDITGKDIISIFEPESPHKVCEKNVWFSDAFDPLVYGRPFDFGKPFFEQFRQLALAVPLPSLRIELSENCEYNNDMRACANCYLCARTHQSQNLLYTYRGTKSNDCVDCLEVTACAFLYECVECVNCQDSRYLYFCNGCANSAFLLDCRNCFDCFMCCNLRNAHHCFFNEQLTSKDYEARVGEFLSCSNAAVEHVKGLFSSLIRNAIRRNLNIVSCENVSGDNILNSKSCYLCFGAQKCQDARYLWDVKLHRDAMDEYSGGRDSELMYETTSGSGSYDVQFCLRASDSRHVRYSFYITSSKNIFGSVGLRQQELCILNKRYSESEYDALLPRVIEHMQRTGEWGEFFPAELSPFAYNETVAQEYFPLDQPAANTLGYRWLKDQPRISKAQSYIVPDSISGVSDDVLKQTFSCERCEKNYKIVQQELAYYRAHQIPLPKLCHDCRHLARLATRNPPQLRQTVCSKCGDEMMTSFPEGTEVRIFCADCYLEEMG